MRDADKREDLPAPVHAAKRPDLHDGASRRAQSQIVPVGPYFLLFSAIAHLISRSLFKGLPKQKEGAHEPAAKRFGRRFAFQVFRLELHRTPRNMQEDQDERRPGGSMSLALSTLPVLQRLLLKVMDDLVECNQFTQHF